jgi:hypothetical protein
MRDQLRRLVWASQLPNVSLLILPFDAGEHAFMGGSAALLEFPEIAHPAVVYLEGLAGDYYEEQPSEVAHYVEEFDRLAAKALDQTSSINCVNGLLSG